MAEHTPMTAAQPATIPAALLLTGAGLALRVALEAQFMDGYCTYRACLLRTTALFIQHASMDASGKIDAPHDLRWAVGEAANALAEYVAPWAAIFGIRVPLCLTCDGCKVVGAAIELVRANCRGDEAAAAEWEAKLAGAAWQFHRVAGGKGC